MMNIKQLNTAIDSLSIAYDKKQQSNDDALVKRFQYLNLSEADYQRADAKMMKKHGDAVSNDTISTFIWPLIDNIPENERQSVLGLALASTTNMKESLTVSAKDMQRDRINIRKHEQVLNQKFTLSIACLLFFFIGAPLGAIIRKGGLGMPVVVSVTFFVIYYVITIIGERVAVNGDMSVFLGAWISSLVLFPIGFFLTFKATTDAALLDAESWKKFFTKHKKDETI
jgi:lipopolysaccharide export system permease protein